MLAKKIQIKKIIEKGFLLGIFLFSISLLFPENFRNIPIIIFGIIVLLSFFDKIHYKWVYIKTLIVNTLLFFVLLISLIYSENLDYGIKMITGMLSLIIIPICFFVTSSNRILITKKYLSIFYRCFYISTTLYFFGVLLQNYFNNFLNESIFLHFSERLNSSYGKYSLHPLYASIYIVTSLILSTKVYPKTQSKSIKTLFIFSIFFLVVVLFMLARKGPIISTIIIFTIYFFIEQKKRVYKVLFLLILAGFFFVSYQIIPIKERYFELFQSFLNFKIDGLGSTSFRLNIYDCALKTIKQSPFFGYGIGDTKNILTECYIQKQNIYSGLYFNSHNQFLSSWLAAGILGLISLTLIFYYNFNLAKKEGFIYISMIILFLLVMLIENILERQNGVILFSFFINLFAFKASQKLENK